MLNLKNNSQKKKWLTDEFSPFLIIDMILNNNIPYFAYQTDNAWNKGCQMRCRKMVL